MRLALFDLDNTLIDRYAAFARWAADFADAHALPQTETAWLIETDGSGFVPRADFFLAVWSRYRLDAPVEQLVRDFSRTIPEYTVIDPDVPAALRELRGAGWRVGIVTNGTSLGQNAKVDRAGLRDAVDAVVVSEASGVRKPDRKIFTDAAQACGLDGGRDLDGGWMVGDCPVRDVGGGRAAGLRTAWMRWNRPWPVGSPPPDLQVDTVLEAVAHLASIT